MKSFLFMFFSLLLAPILIHSSTITFPGPNGERTFTENGHSFSLTEGDGYMWNTDYHSASFCALCNTSYGSIILTKTAGNTFKLNSLWIKGAWAGFQLVVKGYNGASQLYSTGTISVSASYAQTTLSNWTGINKIVVTGVSNGTFFIDDIDYTLENAAPTDISLSNSSVPDGSASGTTVGTFSTTDSEDPGGHIYTFASGGTDNPSFTISGTSLITAFVADAATKNSYSIKIRVTDTGSLYYEKNFTITITVVDLYPAISFTDQTWDFITNVTFNTINNTTDGSDGGYNHYTDVTTTVNKLETYTLSVSNPPDGVMDPLYPENIKAWIDWNNNKSFDDVGEAYEVGANLTTHQVSSVDVLVPTGASEGNTRMRIAILGASPASFPPNSGVLDYGEAEDYTIQIGAALPVELVSFTASMVKSTVTLNWQTATEVNNYGFEVERSEILNGVKNLQTQNWHKISFIEGCGNSNSPKEYSFKDYDYDYEQDYELQYRLKQIDIDGSFSYSDIVEVTLNEQPSTFELFQNYPNPFNPTTVISYQLPVVSKVQIKVYDILGNEVETLVNETKEPGIYQVEFDGSNLSSGIYFYKLQTGNGLNIIKKLVLMK
ncbi:MAG: GEVED domain-containing protein [bacterium]